MKYVLATVLTLALCLSAKAQAILSFSGGNGSPLTITLHNSLVYEVDTLKSANGPVFVFEDVFITQDYYYSPLSAQAGAITFEADGSTRSLAQVVGNSFFNPGFYKGDLAIYGSTQFGMAVGNTFILNAGTITTNYDYAGVTPLNGVYSTHLTNGNFEIVGYATSLPGSPIPEPSTYCAIFGAIALAGTFIVRRRKLAAAN